MIIKSITNKLMDGELLSWIIRRKLTRWIELKRLISTIITNCFCQLYKIHLGKNCVFYGRPFFFRAENSKIDIGNNCEFRSEMLTNLIGVRQKCMLSTLNKDAEIIIGDNSGFSGVTIAASKRIVIGKKVIVGANSLITDTNWHNLDPQKRNLPDDNPCEIEIEDNVFIGYGCVILKGVKIGRNSVIGANSVVTKNIPENVIAAGNPCIIQRNLK
jgi:acetyltransferase-like isoleucine patch superfamily enzyme